MTCEEQNAQAARKVVWIWGHRTNACGIWEA